jgi:hypothetical protein
MRNELISRRKKDLIYVWPTALARANNIFKDEPKRRANNATHHLVQGLILVREGLKCYLKHWKRARKDNGILYKKFIFQKQQVDNSSAARRQFLDEGVFVVWCRISPILLSVTHPPIPLYVLVTNMGVVNNQFCLYA